MYFWPAQNIRCMRPSRTSLTSSAEGRDRWMATSASCRDTSAERIAQCRSTRMFGKACWNSTSRGASQKVPRPSVTATRTSPESVLATNCWCAAVEGCRLHALDRGDHQRAFVGQLRAVDVAREQGGADLALEIVDPAAHGVDRQIEPLGRGTKTAATHDFQENAGRVPIGETADGDLLAFLLWNAPFPTRRIQSPFGPLNLAEYARNHNHCGSEPTVFHVNDYSQGQNDHSEGRHREPRDTVGQQSRVPEVALVSSVVSLRTFANSSSVPIVVFVDMQQEYLAKPRLLAISEIDRALDKLPEGSRPFAPGRTAGSLHPDARRIGLLQPGNAVRALDRGLRAVPQ